MDSPKLIILNDKELRPGFIVQARMGSSRLPGKLMMEFAGGKTLLEIITGRIIRDGNDIPLIVATTDESRDDILVKKLDQLGVSCFRGSEDDVLERFISCSKQNELHTIIRICADNPFIDIMGTVMLLDEFRRGQYDYVAYRMAPGLPSIKSHIGLWGEVVSLEALERVSRMTGEKRFREHVTNFIYENPRHFNLKFLDAPFPFYERQDIRLTLDDREDFIMLRKIHSYSNHDILNFEPAEVLQHIRNNPDIIERMRKQISKYQK